MAEAEQQQSLQEVLDKAPEVPADMFVEDSQAAPEPETPAKAQPEAETPPTETEAPTPATEAEPAQADKVNPDRKIEQLGYRVSQLTDKFDRLLQQLEQQGGQATQQQQRQLQNAAQEAEQLAEIADGDFVDGRTYRALRGQLDHLNARLGQVEQTASQVAGQTSVQAFEANFARENPTLAGRFQELRQLVQQRVATELEGENDPGVRTGYARAIWNQEVAKAKGSATPNTPAKPNVVPRPSAQRSASAPPSTRITPQGASRRSVPPPGSDEGKSLAQLMNDPPEMPADMYRPDGAED